MCLYLLGFEGVTHSKTTTTTSGGAGHSIVTTKTTNFRFGMGVHLSRSRPQGSLKNDLERAEQKYREFQHEEGTLTVQEVREMKGPGRKLMRGIAKKQKAAELENVVNEYRKVIENLQEKHRPYIKKILEERLILNGYSKDLGALAP